MNERNFEELLNRHGSDLSVWPEHLRNEANELLSENTTAHAMLNAQATVDQVLNDVMVVPKPYSLEQRVMARFAGRKRWFELGQFSAFFWKPAFAAAFSLAFGFYLGAANQELPIDLAEDLTYVTFYDYEEWSGDTEDES